MNGSVKIQPLICPHCHEKIDNQRLTIHSPKLLIVEGKDEEGFFAAFLRALTLSEIQVAGIGGKTQIGPNLKALVKDPDFSKIVTIGLIRDANANPKAAFQSVQDALKAADLPVPKQLIKSVAGPPKVAVMLLPPTGRGELEDLCLEAVKDEPIMNCVNQYFECVEDLGLKRPRKLSKAKVAALLSYHEDPINSVGLSAQKGFWDFNKQAFSKVRNFLLSL
ncbi:MAG: hypothetical protein HY892_19565 [Deltaproteobacteria bacterium]|nr:hypothetical protein [Deltaproteobacteria bacterium]